MNAHIRDRCLFPASITHSYVLSDACPAEIIEYSSPEETAVCNLASIALPRFVRETEPHGREGKKLVGSLDAANRSGKGNPTNSQPVCLPAAGHFSLHYPLFQCSGVVALSLSGSTCLFLVFPPLAQVL